MLEDLQLDDLDEAFILWVAAYYEQTRKGGAPLHRIARELGVQEKALEPVIARLKDRGLFYLNDPKNVVFPKPPSLDAARLVRERRRERSRPDLVDRALNWARRKPAIACMILILQALSGVVGLLGGILGILAFLSD